MTTTNGEQERCASCGLPKSRHQSGPFGTVETGVGTHQFVSRIDEIRAERERLDTELADAFIAVRETPAFRRYEAAEIARANHVLLYGTDLTTEPRGLYHPRADVPAAMDHVQWLTAQGYVDDNGVEHRPTDAGYALPDELPDDDGRCDFTEGDVIT